MGHVVVTGPAGFVGTHLRAELGEAFVAFDGDVLEPDPLREAVRGADAVVHLAAESSVAASWHDVWHTWRVNVDGTVNLRPLLSLSQADLHVRFRPSDRWLTENGMIKSALGLIPGTARQGDGSYAFTFTGPLARMTPRPGR